MTLSKEKLMSAIESLMRHPNSFFGETEAQEVAAGLRELLERRERDKQEPRAWLFWPENDPSQVFIVDSDKDPAHKTGDVDSEGQHWVSSPLYAAPPASSYTEAMLRGAQAQMRCILGDLELPENTPFVEVLNAIYALKNPEPPAPVVDRQSIINKVQGLCSRMPGATFSNAAEFAIDEVLQSFGNSEQLNSPVVPDGWIKCSDRMPAPQELIYIYHPDYGVDGDVWYEERAGEFKWGDDTRGRHISTVTHWMEMPGLPAAPKQESE